MMVKQSHMFQMQDGSVELRALDETGSHYYKILGSTKLCPYQGIPTKVFESWCKVFSTIVGMHMKIPFRICQAASSLQGYIELSPC